MPVADVSELSDDDESLESRLNAPTLVWGEEVLKEPGDLQSLATKAMKTPGKAAAKEKAKAKAKNENKKEPKKKAKGKPAAKTEDSEQPEVGSEGDAEGGNPKKRPAAAAGALGDEGPAKRPAASKPAVAETKTKRAFSYKYRAHDKWGIKYDGREYCTACPASFLRVVAEQTRQVKMVPGATPEEMAELVVGALEQTLLSFNIGSFSAFQVSLSLLIDFIKTHSFQEPLSRDIIVTPRNLECRQTPQ